jgi:hypothetical protein
VTLTVSDPPLPVGKFKEKKNTKKHPKKKKKKRILTQKLGMR